MKIKIAVNLAVRMAISMLVFAVLLSGTAGCGREEAGKNSGGKRKAEQDETEGNPAGDRIVTGADAAAEEELQQRIEEVLYPFSAASYASVSLPDTLWLRVLSSSVTEEELEVYLQDFLGSFSTFEQITDRVTEEGDMAAISYDVFEEGKLVESYGSDVAPAMALLQRSEREADILSRLIGQRCGEEIRFSIPCPEMEKGAGTEADATRNGSAGNGEANNDTAVNEATGNETAGNETAGNAAAKDRQVIATVHWIRGRESVPELDQSFVESLSGYQVSSVEELEEILRQELASYKKNRSDYYKQLDLWQEIMENVQITGYPEGMQERCRQEIEQEYRRYADWYGFGSMEEYGSEVLGMTAQEFDRYLEDMAKSHCEEELAIMALTQERTEFRPDPATLREGMAAYAYTYGYDGGYGDAAGGNLSEDGQEEPWRQVILALAKNNILTYLESIAEITFVDSLDMGTIG